MDTILTVIEAVEKIPKPVHPDIKRLYNNLLNSTKLYLDLGSTCKAIAANVEGRNFLSEETVEWTLPDRKVSMAFENLGGEGNIALVMVLNKVGDTQEYEVDFACVHLNYQGKKGVDVFSSLAFRILYKDEDDEGVTGGLLNDISDRYEEALSSDAEEHKNIKSLIKSALQCLRLLLGTCELAFNLKADYEEGPKSTAKSLRRVAKGKRPIVKVLRVNLDLANLQDMASAKEPLGGHHASPVPHDRRGHWRVYKDGRRVFIKSSKVRGGTVGMTIKSYHITDSRETSK